MQNILCYGDSNTYGFNPNNGGRFDSDTRWTGILKTLLKDKYKIIEAGMNNRTGFVENPQGFIQSGGLHLPVYLKECPQIDICVLALGTNDLQFTFNITIDIVEQGLTSLINCVKENNQETNILVISPPTLDTNILKGGFSHQFDNKSIKDSKAIQQIYKKTTEINNCKLIDLNNIVSPDPIDGLHYSANSHRIIAETIAKSI